MDNSFRGSRQFSHNLNSYGSERPNDGVSDSKNAPGEEFNKITLSTDEHSIELDKDDLDETTLKNILYCYKFLDTTDKEYINSAESELYIRQIKDENPQLFELLLDVLQVASEHNPNDTNIAKNLFITKLKQHIKNIKPDDNPSLHSLKSTSNPITTYFKNFDVNTERSVSETVFEPVSANSKPFHTQKSSDAEPYFNKALSKVSQESKETFFNLGSLNNLNEVKGLSSDRNSGDELSNEDLKKFESDLRLSKKESITSPNNSRNVSLNRFENVNKFDSVAELEKFLNCNGKVDEYIVFNYNLEYDWQKTLREDYDLIFNV